MNQHLEAILIRLSRLFRARVVVCMVGLYAIHEQPEAAQWIAVVCGLAIGISGIEEIVNGKKSK